MMQATVTDDGHIKCPKCGTIIMTPVGLNPNNGKEEKMILKPHYPGQCRLCETDFRVDAEQALKHNRFWYPDDPEFKDEG